MKKIRVVLTRDFRQLGNIGDVVEVRRGYARNFLIPRNIAIEEMNAARYKKIAEQIQTARKEAIERASKLAKILQGKELVFIRKSAEGGRLFGSVTTSDIHAALADQGITIDESCIRLAEPIKSIGKHTVPVKLHSQVVVDLNVVVNEEKQIGSKKDQKSKSAEDSASQRKSKSMKSEASSNTSKRGKRTFKSKVTDKK